MSWSVTVEEDKEYDEERYSGSGGVPYLSRCFDLLKINGKMSTTMYHPLTNPDNLQNKQLSTMLRGEAKSSLKRPVANL
jgi:hypothetical protein